MLKARTARSKALGTAVLILACIVVPLLPWLARALSGGAADLSAAFRLNVLLYAVLIAAVGGTWIRKSIKASKEMAVVAACFTFVSAWFLPYIALTDKAPAFDYRCIQNAALKIMSGQLPYGEETGYVLYPPFYAQAMTQCYRAVLLLGKQFHWHPQAAQVFDLLFYLFQNAQFLAIIAMLYGAVKFLERTGRVSLMQATLLSSAVIVLSYPMTTTIIWNQVNIFITCLILFACAFLNRSACARGLALALGINIKVYPMLLLPALFLARQRRACLWAIIWTATIAGISSIGFGTAIWNSYYHCAQVTLANYISNAQSYAFILNGPTLFSLIVTGWHFLWQLGLAAHKVSFGTANALAMAGKCLLMFWFAWRMVKRHRRKDIDAAAAATMSPAATAIFYDDVSDLLSFGLLCGPTTLHHHFVLAIPVLLWTIVRSGMSSPVLVLLGWISIMAFDAANMSVNYLVPVGLLLLAIARREVAEPGVALAAEAGSAGQKNSHESKDLAATH